MLVNKFGDPERKTAAKVSYQLLQLLQKHPAMQGVVVSEIERFLMRPNLNPRAIYISVIFLNQLVLDTTPAGGATARKLIGASLLHLYARLSPFSLSSARLSLRGDDDTNVLISYRRNQGPG